MPFSLPLGLFRPLLLLDLLQHLLLSLFPLIPLIPTPRLCQMRLDLFPLGNTLRLFRPGCTAFPSERVTEGGFEVVVFVGHHARDEGVGLGGQVWVLDSGGEGAEAGVAAFLRHERD